MVKQINEGLSSVNVEEEVDISRIRKLAGLANNNGSVTGEKVVSEGHDIDHEVQMARADLYKIAEYAIKLHELLSQISEQEGIEGWVQAKITKASDYISSVYHYLDYDKRTGNSGYDDI